MVIPLKLPREATVKPLTKENIKFAMPQMLKAMTRLGKSLQNATIRTYIDRNYQPSQEPCSPSSFSVQFTSTWRVGRAGPSNSSCLPKTTVCVRTPVKRLILETFRFKDEGGYEYEI